jgi:hypothetical protein
VIGAQVTRKTFGVIGWGSHVRGVSRGLRT